MSMLLGKATEETVETVAAMRPVLGQYLQTARTASGAITAIAIGFVSLSFGMATMGVQTLADLAREVVQGS